MAQQQSLAQLRERLRLEKAISTELEKQVRLRRELRSSISPRPKPKPKKRPSQRAGPPTTRRTKPKPRKASRKPSRSRSFEALHPRGPGGRFLPTKKAQEAQPVPLRRWALFLRPAYGKKVYPNEVIVLILDKDPAEMPESELGAWIREVRQARHEEDSRVRWLQPQGTGEWLDPTVEPGTWWVERREHLD